MDLLYATMLEDYFHIIWYTFDSSKEVLRCWIFKMESCNKLSGQIFPSFEYEPRHEIPTMWYMGPAKAQTSLLICAVWSEPLQVAWIFYEYQAIDQT